MTGVKANEIVIDALEDLVVQADEAPIEPSEARAAIRVLNDMMFMWDTEGIILGYTEVSDLGDFITVARGAIFGIKKNLAIALAPKYDVEPSARLAMEADKGYKACVNIAVEIAATQYPSTLPRGSGNDYPSITDQTFYPEPDETILTESGGSIALEQDTEEA